MKQNGVFKQTWIDGTTNNPTEWIPCSVIKPVVEVVKSFFSEKLGGSVVEVGIKLMNDALKSQH